MFGCYLFVGCRETSILPASSVRYSCHRSAAAIPKPQRGGDNSAQGNALGWMAKKDQALKGRNKPPDPSTFPSRTFGQTNCAALSGLGNNRGAQTQGVALGCLIEPLWGWPRSPPSRLSRLFPSVGAQWNVPRSRRSGAWNGVERSESGRVRLRPGGSRRIRPASAAVGFVPYYRFNRPNTEPRRLSSRVWVRLMGRFEPPISGPSSDSIAVSCNSGQPPCTQIRTQFSGPLGRELARVVRVWERLPKHVRRSITTLVAAHEPKLTP